MVTKTVNQEGNAKYPLPTAANLNRKTVYQLGSQMAELLSLQPIAESADAAYTELENVVQKLGGRISRIGFLELAWRELCVGSIEIHNADEFDIFLPHEYEVGPISSRETLAHELGHYILHHPLSETGTLRANHLGPSKDLSSEKQKSIRQAEREATWFAEALLVPDNALRKQTADQDAQTLARLFHVSEQTILNRQSVS